jgi:long-chain fatty acid transport protein
LTGLRVRLLRWWAAGVLSLTVCSGQGRADAAGFASQTLGGEHGNVVESNPTALYYNPGALGFSGGASLGLYGTLALRSATWTHAKAADDYPDPPGAQGADTGKATLFNVFGGPSIAASMHVSKDLVLAAGFFAPFYGLSRWDKNGAFAGSTMYPQAVDGVQRWFVIDGKVEVLYFSVGSAYRLGPVSLGASANFISSTFSLSQARNIGGTGQPNVAEEGRAQLDAHGYQGSFAAGIEVEAVPGQIYLAASYQAQPGLGPLALDGDLLITPPGQKPTHYSITLHQSLPDVVRAGLRLRPRTLPWELRLFGDYTRWSVFTSQCIAERGGSCSVESNGGQSTGPGDATVLGNIRRDWRDTWGLRVGASYWFAPAVEVFAGAGYETAAVPAATIAPDIADADNVLVALGARFALTEYLFATVSYTQIQYLNRNVATTASTLATSASGVPYVYPTVEGNGGGLYTQWVGLFTGNLEAAF